MSRPDPMFELWLQDQERKLRELEVDTKRRWNAMPRKPDPYVGGSIGGLDPHEPSRYCSKCSVGGLMKVTFPTITTPDGGHCDLVSGQSFLLDGRRPQTLETGGDLCVWDLVRVPLYIPDPDHPGSGTIIRENDAIFDSALVDQVWYTMSLTFDRRSYTDSLRGFTWPGWRFIVARAQLNISGFYNVGAAEYFLSESSFVCGSVNTLPAYFASEANPENDNLMCPYYDGTTIRDWFTDLYPSVDIEVNW